MMYFRLLSNLLILIYIRNRSSKRAELKKKKCGMFWFVLNYVVVH